MRLHYKSYLNQYSKRLRKGGNLSEVLLWNELKHDKLGCRFLRQRPIGKYVVDFYCHSLNMVIEIDGAATHDLKIEKDELRQKHLELLGIKIVRFRDSDIRYNLSSVIENIKSEISRLKAPSLEKRE